MKRYSGREGSRILVVDDDPPTRTILNTIFSRSLGASVIEADCNDAAFLAIAAGRFDLICTDLSHFDEGGESLCQKLRSNPDTELIPILVVSGNVKDDIELRLYRLGVDGVFSKPFAVSELLKRALRLIPGRIDLESAILDVGAESEGLDYKESLPLGDKKARASFAKDVLAMANSGGGEIVVGVAETSPGQFKRVGLSPEDASEMETTKLNDAIRRYVGQSLAVHSRVIVRHGLEFAIVSVPAREIALAYDEQADAGLFKGRVYARTAAARSEEVQDPVLLRRMLMKGSANPSPQNENSSE